MKKRIIDLTDYEVSNICVKHRCSNCPLSATTQFGCIKGYRNLWKAITLNKNEIDYLNKEIEL